MPPEKIPPPGEIFLARNFPCWPTIATEEAIVIQPTDSRGGAGDD